MAAAGERSVRSALRRGSVEPPCDGPRRSSLYLRRSPSHQVRRGRLRLHPGAAGRLADDRTGDLRVVSRSPLVGGVSSRLALPSRISAARLALLSLAGADLRMTLLAIPPLLPVIHAQLGLDEKGVAAPSTLPVLLLGIG